MNKEESMLQKRLVELSRLAYNRGIVVFSDFLNLNELNILHTTPKDMFLSQYKTYGGYDLSERQMAVFLPDALYYEWQFPIAYLELVPSYPKFAEKFTTGFLLLPRLVVRRITPFAPFTPYTAVAEASFNTEID